MISAPSNSPGPTESNLNHTLPSKRPELNRSYGIKNTTRKVSSFIMSYQLSREELRTLALAVQKEFTVGSDRHSTVQSTNDSVDESTIRTYDRKVDTGSASSRDSVPESTSSSLAQDPQRDVNKATIKAEDQAKERMREYHLMIMRTSDEAGNDERTVKRWTPKKATVKPPKPSEGASPVTSEGDNDFLHSA
jgi:hypothetical protein